MPPWWFTSVGLACSVFFGVFAVAVFDVLPPPGLQDEAWKAGRWRESKALPWRVYQGWYNFVGSLAGWCALWALAPASWFTADPAEPDLDLDVVRGRVAALDGGARDRRGRARDGVGVRIVRGRSFRTGSLLVASEANLRARTA